MSAIQVQDLSPFGVSAAERRWIILIFVPSA
jgi:hypothetical protein